MDMYATELSPKLRGLFPVGKTGFNRKSPECCINIYLFMRRSFRHTPTLNSECGGIESEVEKLVLILLLNKGSIMLSLVKLYFFPGIL